jgi:hypothetical protein
MHCLTHRKLVRSGSSSPGATKVARLSIDFVIDGMSLLDQLAKADGGYRDFMGCLVAGFASENKRKTAQLLAGLAPDTQEGRYLLYVCPECGDIGCGSYGAKVKVTEHAAEWFDFAYENGYEPGRVLPHIGPFNFSLTKYKQALESARASAA